MANLIDSTVDWALDRSVIGGYTSLGYRLRGLDDRPVDPAGNLRDSTVIVTGANSGLGFAAAQRFAELDAHVHMVCRDSERGERARAELAELTGSEAIDLHLADISDLDAVRRLAEELDGELDGIDALIHNAGALLPDRQRSAQGHELTFAVHVLGPFLLSRLLEPLLETREGRIVFVTSGGMYASKLNIDDPQLEHQDFDGTRFYAHAKRAQTVLSAELDWRTPEGVSCHAMHPGWVATPGVSSSLPRFESVMGPLLRNPDQGADTAVWLAASDEAPRRSGRLWMDRRSRPTHRVPMTHEDEADPAHLYEICSELVAERMRPPLRVEVG